MADHIDSIPSNRTPNERQLAAVPELQGHVEDHTKQTSATSRRDHCRRASRFQSRKEHYRTIFNIRILCEKYGQHQQNLYHVFLDFKKAFDRPWQEALWETRKKYNINASIIRTIENLYDKAQGAIMFSSSTGE